MARKIPDDPAVSLRGALVAIMVSASLFSVAAYGGELYRWTDDKGRVHYGDSVPVSQKGNATVVDTKNVNVPDAQRREAESRFAKDRDRLNKATGGNGSAATAAIPATKVPPANHGASCEEQWKKYDESWGCFNPYRNANGSVKPEAYERCTEMKAPNCNPSAR